MNEQLLASAILQQCQNLLAIRKSGDWRAEHTSFDTYCKARWSLSKTRAKLLCDFAKFCDMARELKWKMPTSPENIAPILALPQKRWMGAWEVCIAYADDFPINAPHCKATMDQFGIIANKKVPSWILKGKQARKAADTLAGLGDGGALVDEIGPQGLGKHWKEAVKVVIDADERRMAEEPPF